MKKLFLIVSLSTLCFTAFAQVKAKAVLYAPAEWGNDKVRITISNAVAESGFSKAKVQIQNKTENFIIYYANESLFKVDNGEYTHNRDANFRFAKPYDIFSRVVEVAGGNDWRKDAYTFIMNGLYEVSARGTTHPAEDFKLPYSNASFNAGPFLVRITKMDKKTDETVVKFQVVYNGDKIGIVDPVKVLCRTPNAQEFGVYNVNVKPNLLAKGEVDNFTLAYKVQPNVAGGDMQKSDLFLVWKDCFRESDKTPISVAPFAIKMTGTK